VKFTGLLHVIVLMVHETVTAGYGSQSFWCCWTSRDSEKKIWRCML